jgi:hypothetical protein
MASISKCGLSAGVFPSQLTSLSICQATGAIVYYQFYNDSISISANDVLNVRHALDMVIDGICMYTGVPIPYNATRFEIMSEKYVESVAFIPYVGFHNESKEMRVDNCPLYVIEPVSVEWEIRDAGRGGCDPWLFPKMTMFSNDLTFHVRGAESMHKAAIAGSADSTIKHEVCGFHCSSCAAIRAHIPTDRVWEAPLVRATA